MSRPERPSDPPDGYRYDAVPEEASYWRVGGAGKQCAYRRPGFRCPKRSVAALNRKWSHGSRWYSYCGDHLYGRWIENGRIVTWRLISTPTEDGP